jgi:glycine betaine/proline transport system substrate-binding protein
MKKMLIILTVILFSFGLYGCTSGAEQEEQSEENEELVIGLTPWTSSLPPTVIVEELLKDMGYEVEIKEAELGIVYAGLATGELDIFMDSFQPRQSPYLEEYSDSIELVSANYEGAGSGMVVPNYMEDVNDVGDLVGKEDLVDNEIIAIEDGDPAMDELQELIDAYELDIELVNSSEGALLAHARAKTENNEPVLVYGWEPHSMFTDFGLKLLSNEEHSELFNGSSVHPVVNQELKEKAPDAYQVIDGLQIPMEDMGEMLSKIDAEEDPTEVAREWIENNEDHIEELKSGE